MDGTLIEPENMLGILGGVFGRGEYSRNVRS